jgi:WD40 repeat protein
MHIISSKQFDTGQYGGKCIFANDKCIVTASNNIKIWDAISHKQIGKTINPDAQNLHHTFINFVIMHNNHVISSNDDVTNTIKIWDVKLGSCMQILEGHKQEINTLFAFNNIIVSGSQDATIKLWNMSTGKCLKTLYDHSKSVNSVFVINKILISGSSDLSVKLWNFETSKLKLIHTLMGHSDIITSVFGINNKVISGSRDTTIKVWDMTTGECLNTLVGHASGVQSIFVENNIMVSVSHCKFNAHSGYVRAAVKIWNIDSGECLKTLVENDKYTTDSAVILKNKIICCSVGEFIKIHEYITNEQLFTALMCMWKLNYPTEIIHEIFKWLGIDTYV